MTKAIHSMIRVIDERHFIESCRFAVCFDATYARFEPAGFELRNTVEFNPDGSQFDTGAAEDRSPTVNALSAGRIDRITSERELRNL